MGESDPDRIALRFVNEINRHDEAALFELMAPGFRFVDRLGQEIRGRERMREALHHQFVDLPDYRIDVRDHLTLGLVVALFGTASGSRTEVGDAQPHHRWSLPMACRAVVRDGRVEEWQVYSDAEPSPRPAPCRNRDA